MNDLDNEKHRRADDDIDTMLRNADDKEQREMLLVLKRLADSIQLNNEMTLRGNSALQAHIEAFQSFKADEFSVLRDEIMKKEAKSQGFFGALNKFSKPIAFVIWALTISVFSWGFNRVNETSQVLNTHLSVSIALDERRDREAQRRGEEIDALGRQMAVLVEQHRREK